MGSALDTSIHTNPDTSIQGRFFIQLSRYIFYIKDFFSTFEYNNTIVFLCNSFWVHFPLETLLSTFLPFKPSQYITFLPSPLSIDHLLRTFLPWNTFHLFQCSKYISLLKRSHCISLLKPSKYICSVNLLSTFFHCKIS